MKREEKQKVLDALINMSGKFFSEVVEDNEMMLAYCKGNSDIWSNYALLKKQISEEKIETIECFFKTRNRIPVIYFLDGEFEKTAKILFDKGFVISSKDCWMFWEGKEPDAGCDHVMEVKTDSNFERWISTFVQSYPKNDPQNPYGEQSSFAKVLHDAWNRGKLKRDKLFLAFEENVPVAVGILTNYNGMGYISGIGAIPAVRGRGFGKKISLHCVKESFGLGNKSHFLATEKGHYPYEFYKRIGFKPEFEASYYSLLT